MESGTIEVLQCDINQVYRCEVNSNKYFCMLYKTLSFTQYASCRQPFSRRDDVFIHARLFHVQHSSTVIRKNYLLQKKILHFFFLRRFNDVYGNNV
jgi:hypothetical protein